MSYSSLSFFLPCFLPCFLPLFLSLSHTHIYIYIHILIDFPHRWHGTILAKLALVPQNLLNAYATGPANPKYGAYKQGDLVANFPGCAREKPDCAAEHQPYFDILNKNAV